MKGIDSPSLDPLEAGKRGEICLFRSFVDQNKICQLQGRLPSNVPAHGKQTNKHENTLFLQMVGISKAVKLEVWSLMRNILQSLVGPYAWMMLKIFFSLARLGQEGRKEVSNRWQVQGEMIHQAITQDQRGTALMQSLRSSGGMPYQGKARCILQGILFFTRATELTRATMAATRSCVCFASNEDAGKWHAITGECLAAMLYECFVHQTTTIGDASKMAHRRRGQQLNFLYCMWAFYFGWAELSWQWVHSWIMLQDMLRESSNLRTVHIAPHVCLKFLKEQPGEKVDVEEDIRKKTTNIGDGCTLAFYEFGHVHVQRGEYRRLPWFLCVWESRNFKYWKNKCHFFFWQMTFFFFFFFFFAIEILIRIALFWWSGLSPLIFSTKRRRVSRVMLEGRNEQTRGRAKSKVLRYNFQKR